MHLQPVVLLGVGLSMRTLCAITGYVACISQFTPCCTCRCMIHTTYRERISIITKPADNPFFRGDGVDHDVFWGLCCECLRGGDTRRRYLANPLRYGQMPMHCWQRTREKLRRTYACSTQRTRILLNIHSCISPASSGDSCSTLVPVWPIYANFQPVAVRKCACLGLRNAIQLVLPAVVAWCEK
jgi:hypothetical protein